MSTAVSNLAVSAHELEQLTLPGDYEVRAYEYTPMSFPAFEPGPSYYQATIHFVPAKAGFRGLDVMYIDKKFPANQKGAEARARKSADAMLKALRELRARTGERFEVAFKIAEREAGRKTPRQEQLVAAIKKAVK